MTKRNHMMKFYLFRYFIENIQEKSPESSFKNNQAATIDYIRDNG